MPYCVKCGVELDGNVPNCPLCGTSVTLPESEWGTARKYPDPEVTEVRDRYTTEERYRKALEAITLLLLVPFLILMSIDIIVTRNLSWSRIPLTALVYTWMIFFFPLFFRKNPAIVIIGEVTSVTMLVAMIDFVANFRFEWFLTVAVPLLVFLFVLVSLVVLLSAGAKRKGANIAAYIIAAVGLFCVFIEIIVGYSIYSDVRLFWSPFVLAPCLVIAASLLYFHHRIKRLKGFRRFFDF